MFRTGQTIGQYTLINQLGRGGFGEVWLAEKRTKFVTTRVAVKLPLDEQVDHETIKHEATLWQQASGHPNILPIIDADEYDGQIVIVSEYAPDGSLEQLLKTHGKLEIKQAVEMTVGILNGLEFLHSRNIIHRDLKPANILLQGTTPRLADFGISRAMRTTMASRSQNISGTFAYMSPEALDGKRNEQTDIWSVGVNLYQFLTGTLPFPQTEPSMLFPAIIMREPELLPDFVSSELKQIIAKTLEKNPETRYQNAVEMREDLKKYLVNISFPQFAPTEISTYDFLQNNISAPTTIEDEVKANDTEKEIDANEKTANYLTETKPSYQQDSIITQVNDSPSIITKPAVLKIESKTRDFSNSAQNFREKEFPWKPIIIGGVAALLVVSGLFFSWAFFNSFLGFANISNNNTNSQTTKTVALPNKQTTTFSDQIDVELKASSYVSISYQVDGKARSILVNPDNSLKLSAKQNLKIAYAKSLAKDLQMTLNGKQIALPLEPGTPKRLAIEFEINKENIAQILESKKVIANK